MYVSACKYLVFNAIATVAMAQVQILNHDKPATLLDQLSTTHDYIERPTGGQTAAAPIQSEPLDGSTVSYTSFEGTNYSLIQYNGINVAFLVKPASLALKRYSVAQLRGMIDHLDVLYAHFREIMGSEPPGGPLIHIAFVKNCGGGCGQIGSKGIELAPEMLDPAHGEYPDGSPYLYSIHEMTHNFDLYSSYIMYGPDVVHAWTDFMNFYITVYNQEGFFVPPGDYPAALLKDKIGQYFAPYLSYTNSSWTTCIHNNACDPANSMEQHAQGGMALRIAQLHGPESVKSSIQYLKNIITTRSLNSSQMSDLAKNDVLLESLGNGARADLSCYVDAWKWPISSSLRTQLGAFGANVNCADQDGDGYSVVQGDCNDLNSLVHPGATEIINGIDDDCNGIVDDVLVQEASEFGQTTGTATIVPIPVRISGSILTPTDADNFQMFLAVPTTVSFTLRSLDAFKGWLFVNKQGTSEWLQYVFASSGPMILDLAAGSWTFSVEYNSSSVVGNYEVLVVPSTHWPSTLAAPASSNSLPGTEILMTPTLPQELAGISPLTARFWVEHFGWVGSRQMDANGPASFTWATNSAHCGLSYRVQFVAGGLPVSPTSQPAEFLVPGGTCTEAPPQFAYSGQAVLASGGSGSVNLTFPAGVAWTASSSANWITFTGSVSGTGNGTLSYQVAANAGADRSGTITVAGLPFTVEQQSATIAGLNFIGSMAHLAAQENWTTAITLVNKGNASAQARASMFGDATDPSGNGPLGLLLAFPQQPSASGPLVAASFDRTLNAYASLTFASVGSQTSPVLQGSAQLAATGAVDGFAIFHQILTAQEAVVPLETRNASSYLLAFDNTSGLVLGVAVENVSAQTAIIPVIIRNEMGVVISTPGASISLGGNGHTAFVLSDTVLGFPATANIRGTVEFDTPASGRISVLGLRFTPPNNALTTIPALANVGTTGGSIAHLASGGDGWQTTFVLVNAGTTSAQATLNFYADQTGAPMPLPLTFPQNNTADLTAPSVTKTLAAGATLMIVSSGAQQLLTGSAQLSTTGNLSGFVIFRHNNQEAVVPLESRNANAYTLAFDNTNGTATGVAVNTVSTQTVTIPVIVRNDTGTTIATDTITMAANGHYAFTLGTDKYPAAATIRGTIEFDKPAGAQIGALGIRIPALAAHTYTTLPALAK